MSQSGHCLSESVCQADASITLRGEIESVDLIKLAPTSDPNSLCPTEDHVWQVKGAMSDVRRAAQHLAYLVKNLDYMAEFSREVGSGEVGYTDYVHLTFFNLPVASSRVLPDLKKHLCTAETGEYPGGRGKPISSH